MHITEALYKEDKNCTFTPQLSTSYMRRNNSEYSILSDSKMFANQFDDFYTRQNN
jgi:hypothetical protein